MDIDKEFINSMGIPIDADEQNGMKIKNIDVEINETATFPFESENNAVERNDEIITEVKFNQSNDNDSVYSSENKTSADNEENAETKNNNDTLVLDEVKKVSAEVSDIARQVNELKAAITKFSSYDTAVETLKRSLSAHQNNEANIHKELEGYKKNQYFNYIRPFIEFLISLLSDMKGSIKQYESDKEKFIEQHGEEIYDEIIGLHSFYIQQIESQIQIQGVEIIDYEINTSFVPMEQLISTPVLTEDSSLVGLVASVDSACYKFEDKIIKKAKVHVYKAK